MICLFYTIACDSCKRILAEIPDNWAGQIKFLEVKFDEETKQYRAYYNNIPIGEEAPVDTIPTLAFFETNEVYTGYKDIMTRLKNG